MATVLALGGCGGVGRYAIPTIMSDAGVDIILAALDEARAIEQAEAYGPRVVPLGLDVTDTPALRRAIERCDLVMNTVGPFFRFGVPILSATLDVGRAYVDVCDDWEPTLAMLELDRLARERGVPAIVGMGITPGVSNLLALLAAEELDEATQLITGWDVDAALPEEVHSTPSAATVHGVEQLTGLIRVRRGGQWSDEKPIKAIEVDYPGIGPRKAWTIGHPEPVTLPRAIPSLNDCFNVMVTSPGSARSMRFLRWFVDKGIIGKTRAARIAEVVEGAGGATPDLAEVVARAEDKGRMDLPPIFALAAGTRQGQSESVGVMLLSAPDGGIGGTTGVPLGLAVRLVLAGAVSSSGVLPPEQAFEPREFLDQLAPLCGPQFGSAADLLLVSRSWESPNLLLALRDAVAQWR